MSLFKRSPELWEVKLSEPYLETTALECAIVKSNVGSIGYALDGSVRKLSEFIDEANERMMAVAKKSGQYDLIMKRAEYLKSHTQVSPLERRMLYVRFDIEKLGTTYGDAAFKVLFRSVPMRRLCGCELFFGDTNYMEKDKAICAIGLGASRLQLELVQQSMSKSLEFKGVCAPTPLILKDENPYRKSEPLVNVGTVLLDGVKNPDKAGFELAVSVYENMKARGELSNE